MKYATHGNGQGLDDLHLLPETPEEQEAIVEFLKEVRLNYRWLYADVEGHEWFGMQFIEVPFCENWKEAIERFLLRS